MSKGASDVEMGAFWWTFIYPIRSSCRPAWAAYLRHSKPIRRRSIHESINRSGFAFLDSGKMSKRSVILYYSNMVSTVCPVAQAPNVKAAIDTLRGDGVTPALDVQDVKWIIPCIAVCM